jgi:hypothetical protein
MLAGQRARGPTRPTLSPPLLALGMEHKWIQMDPTGIKIGRMAGRGTVRSWPYLIINEEGASFFHLINLDAVEFSPAFVEMS